MSENGEIYSAGKNFTLPPALTAWTNSTSDCVVHYFVFTIFTCISSVSISCTNTFHIASHILPRSLYHTIMIVWNYSGTGRVFMYSQKNRVSPNRLLSSQYQDHRAIFSGDVGDISWGLCCQLPEIILSDINEPFTYQDVIVGWHQRT